MKIKKKPVVKNTFWMIYEEEFKTIFFIFGFFFGVLLLAIILVGLAYCWESVKCVFKYVAIIGSIIGIIYPMIKYIKYFLNQRRIPLTMEELGELNIKTVEEYSEYLYKFLNGILPNRKLIIRIFLVAYFKFNEDKGYKEIHQSLCSSNVPLTKDYINEIVSLKTDITVLSDEMYEKNFTDLFKDSWLVDAFNTQDVFKLKCNNYKYELIFLSSTILLPFLIDFIPGLVITIIILAFVCEK